MMSSSSHPRLAISSLVTGKKFPFIVYYCTIKPAKFIGDMFCVI